MSGIDAREARGVATMSEIDVRPAREADHE